LPEELEVAEPVRQLESDGDLVRAVQAGSADAFSELFRRHYPSVHRACARRLGNPVDAEEVAQATFARAFERIDQCTGKRRFGPWVHVIAQRLCVDAMRARARVSPEEVPVPTEKVSAGEGPEQSVIEWEEAQHVHKALATLSRRQREAVVARAVQERRPPEIAADLGVSVGAVDSLLMRARRSLASAYHRVAGERGSSGS
jgi:RNA polymerase sigma-70 factor (ECF subfamily)